MVHIHGSSWAIPWFSKRADLSCQRPLSVFKIFYPDFQKKKTAFRLSAEPNRRQSFPFCFITSKWAPILFYQLWQKIPALRGFEGYCRQYSASFSPVRVLLSGACHKNKSLLLTAGRFYLGTGTQRFFEGENFWMECCRRPDRTTADRTETHGTHQQGASGSFSADASSSVSSLPFGSIIFSRCPRRNNQTVSHTGFGSGSGGLSAVSENFWARKKRLIYQSLFHFFSQKNSKSHHITTHRILESEIIA